MMYDSLQTKILPLPDSTEVFPAHGAGSMCGRNMSKETSSTLGVQRQLNYALNPMSREEFVHMMTCDLSEAPAYFSKDAEINRLGAPSRHEAPLPRALSAAEVAQRASEGCVVLDVRPSAAFGEAHVPGAINIGLSGQFASWAGSLLDMSTPILLVADDLDRVQEAVMRLARVGLENVQGYLEEGMEGWGREGLAVGRVPQLSADALAFLLAADMPLQVLDVRRPPEFENGHIAGAVHVPLSRLVAAIDQLDRDRPTAVICQSGYRSSAATSLLARNGFTQICNVVGGMNAYMKWTKDAPQVKSVGA
jgi:hydroxyacylglutathione hydrolase